MPKPPLSPGPAPRHLDDLPASDTKRWHVNRKAEVVLGVRHGVISLEEACRRYKLSVEEFASWQRLIDEHGLLGLRVTYGKQYRKPGPGAAKATHPQRSRLTT
jgi:hypothetical protein